MRIDAHQHFWRYDPARDHWITDQMSVLKRDYLPEHLPAAEMDASVVVQTAQNEQETHFLVDLTRFKAHLAAVVGWVDLRGSDVRQRLEYFSQFEKLRGFRHIAQSEPDDCFLIRDDFLRGVSNLERFDFTYDILIYPNQLPAAAELIRRFPKQRFVIDHMAKPFIKTGETEPWATWMRKIGRFENVFCKLSGLVTEADWAKWTPADFTPYLDVVFEAFGTDRLMFGSDWPVCLLAGGYGEALAVAGNDADVLAGTAIRTYGLEVA